MPAHLAHVVGARTWVVVQRVPDTHVTLLCQAHQAVDDGGALGVVVEVVHHVAQTVQDNHVRVPARHPVVYHVDALRRHVAPPRHVAQTKHVQPRMVAQRRVPRQPVHALGEPRRVDGLLLRVHIHHRQRMAFRPHGIGVQLQTPQPRPHVLGVRLQGCRHKHLQKEGLAVLLLARDGLNAAQRRELHALEHEEEHRVGIVHAGIEDEALIIARVTLRPHSVRVRKLRARRLSCPVFHDAPPYPLVAFLTSFTITWLYQRPLYSCARTSNHTV